MDGPDSAFTNEIDPLSTLGHGALLASDLNDAIILAGRGDHRLALVNRKRQRFLAVNVFPRFAGVDHRKGVPMIRRCHDDCIDVRGLKHFSVVRV